MTRHINEITESTATFAVYVLAGMTIGLALGMLLAPSSGSEARRYISGRVRDLRKSATNLRRTTGSTDPLEVAEDG
jgi:gas vesicle protein